MTAVRTRISAVAAGLAVAAAGCGSSTPTAPSASAGTITVFAAASLTGALSTLGRRFEAAHPGTTVRFSFGASSTLAQQILAGAPADVFASAATKNMMQVAAEVDTPVDFASNTAQVAVAPAARARVATVRDLAHLRVALCQPQVPCGALAATVLHKAGVVVRPRTLGLDVKSTLAYVTSGQVDAAIVYTTDVRAAGAAVVGVSIPPALNAGTEYPIATVRASRNSALAQTFTAYVESGAGQSVLRAAGFSAP